LLAGLFGSAFVPVAKAAAGNVTAAATTANAAMNEDYATATVAYYSTAVFPGAVYTITTDGDEDGAYELTVSGASLRTCAAVAAGGPAVVVGAVSATGCSLAITDDAGNGGTVVLTATFTKLAAGSSATVALNSPAATNLISAGIATLTGVATTELKNQLSVSKTATATKIDYDGNGTGGEATDLPDTTISSVDYIATAQDLGSVAIFTGVLQNGYGIALDVDTTIVATVTAGNYVNCDEVPGDGVVNGSVNVVALNVADATSDFECEVVSADGAEGQGGAWTLTITSVTGTVIDTFSAGFLGEIATVTATAAYTLVPSNLGANADDVFTVLAEDASGRDYAAKDMLDADIIETNIGTALKVWDNADTTKADIASTELIDSDAPDNGIFELDASVCEDDADAAETRSVQFLYEDGAGATITSNTVTITCGPAVGTALVVSKLEWKAGASVVPGGTIVAKVFMATAAGVVPGAGDTHADVPLVLTNGINADLQNIDGDLDTCTILDGGYCEVSIVAPITVGTAISLYSAAPTNGSLIRAYVSSDAYEAVLTVGPKKLKATADFGPAASKKKIAFVLESASGTTKTFYRRANASGVATYTLNLRGTWTVYATFGDEISDTGTMQR
jgi:hypothetical protein